MVKIKLGMYPNTHPTIKRKMETNIVIKSAEQKLIEQAAEDFAKKVQSVLKSRDVKAVISLYNIPIGKLTDMREFMRDEEGELPTLHVSGRTLEEGKLSYLPRIKGDGYEIEEFSE